jgi:hypothetical protein
VLEGIGQELAGRALGQGGVAKFGDLQGTVARLQAFLDHPFVETPTSFDLKRTDLGFTLTVGVTGRPRATRVLRHLAVGAVTAAERAAREGGGGMKLTSDLHADRASLTVQYQRVEPALRSSDSDAPPTSVRRPAAHSFRPPSLSQEVERILGSHKAPPVPRLTPAPTSYRQSQPSVDQRTSDVQPVAQPVSSRSSVPGERALTERTSDVQPVAPRTSREGTPERTSPASEELRRSKG